jgi:hypothetical protein
MLLRHLPHDADPPCLREISIGSEVDALGLWRAGKRCF